MKAVIRDIRAREVLDSRGRPTVEAEVFTDTGHAGRASVPSGASTGSHEAIELRDKDPKRLEGRGMLKAVANVNGEIRGALLGNDVLDQESVDHRLAALDGTENKGRLGANALLAVSLATARAAADMIGVSLWKRLAGTREPVMPLPMVNMISGGLHAARNLDFQDYLIIPMGARSYRESLTMVLTVYAALGREIAARGFTTLKADEGGYGPPLPDNRAALEIIVAAIGKAGFRPGDDVSIALDVASTHFYDAARRRYALQHPRADLTSAELASTLEKMVDEFPVISIEDGCAEDDWTGWETLSARLNARVQLIGDDLFTTNPKRLRQGIDRGVANSILVKMNQIGTLSETLAVCEMARAHGYAPVISARSGETEDSFLADLAVATGAGQIKVGSVWGSERLAKYNQLLRIEEELGARARFPGKELFQR